MSSGLVVLVIVASLSVVAALLDHALKRRSVLKRGVAKREHYRVNRLCGNCIASYSDLCPYGTPAPHYSECPRCGCKRGFVTP